MLKCRRSLLPLHPTAQLIKNTVVREFWAKSFPSAFSVSINELSDALKIRLNSIPSVTEGQARQLLMKLKVRADKYRGDGESESESEGGILLNKKLITGCMHTGKNE